MKQEDLKVGGVYKFDSSPLVVVCTEIIGEGIDFNCVVINGCDNIDIGYCYLCWIKNFEPFEIGLSLEQGKCKDDIKGGNLNYWHKVSEELPNDNIDVLVKIDIQGYIHYDVDRIIYGEWCNGDDGIIEWKPID